MKDTNNGENTAKKIWTMVKILFVLLIFSAILSALYSGSEDDAVIGYNTAVIPVNGIIMTGGSSGLFEDESASSQQLVRVIEEVKNDPSIEAVIFEINSPGGSPVATDEISQAIKELNDEGIITVAWIRESGASGAYWIASSTDHIVANRMSIVGSIGVYGSYLEFSGFLDDHNITYRRLVSGEYKDAGSPLKEMTPQEEALIQQKLDKLHSYFISAVAENRNMTYDEVKVLATGEIYLGIEALDNDLIDELGGKQEAISYIEQELNTTVVTKEYTKSKSFFESLAGVLNKNSYYIGRGIASGMMIDNDLKIKT
ncbi:MAG TPA: signal peptide peptidase SppA [Alphaproteobacteria bacterium]|nr:signal peptide peptidase SppA [Alphaproteobacteria bacterium]